jgi:hypothetical protein
MTLTGVRTRREFDIYMFASTWTQVSVSLVWKCNEYSIMCEYVQASCRGGGGVEEQGLTYLDQLMGSWIDHLGFPSGMRYTCIDLQHTT